MTFNDSAVRDEDVLLQPRDLPFAVRAARLTKRPKNFTIVIPPDLLKALDIRAGDKIGVVAKGDGICVYKNAPAGSRVLTVFKSGTGNSMRVSIAASIARHVGFDETAKLEWHAFAMRLILKRAR